MAGSRRRAAGRRAAAVTARSATGTAPVPAPFGPATDADQVADAAPRACPCGRAERAPGAQRPLLGTGGGQLVLGCVAADGARLLPAERAAVRDGEPAPAVAR